MATTYLKGTDGHLYATITEGAAKFVAKRSQTDSTWALVQGEEWDTKLSGNTVASDFMRFVLEANKPKDVGTTPVPAEPPPAPIPIPAGKFPALPANTVLQRREDFEGYPLGYHQTNQALADRNEVIADPTGSGFGHVWRCESRVGDAVVAAHANRCEFGQWGATLDRGDYIWREVFQVPADSYLPGSGWQYRAQIHGSNPSTSPPIGIWVRQGSSTNKVAVSFQSGDSRIYHTSAIECDKNTWIYAQFRMRWDRSRGTMAWGEYYVNGQKPAYRSGTGDFDLAKISQGAPAQVYLKFGIDGSPGKGLVALAEQFKVG